MNKKKIIEIAKEVYEDADYKYHILPVVKNALLLAKKLNADAEVVEAAAYLHDIGRGTKREQFIIKDEEEHHATGAEETKKILKDLGHSEEFIQKVAHCVLTHRRRKGQKLDSLEAEIIACADAMAHFDAFLNLFTVFLKTAKFEDAIIEIERKMDTDWNKKLTLLEAKEIAREKYKAITLLLKSVKKYIKQN